MKFRNKINLNFYKYLLFPIFLFAIISCQDEPGDSPFVEDKKTTILIYAVATNSLSLNLDADKEEILKAAENIDLDNNNVIIFETTYDYTPKILKLSKIKGKYEFEKVKELSYDISSLNPVRLSEVLDFVLNKFKAEKYGLIFWSHSTGSDPDLKSAGISSKTMAYSFGQDIDNSTNISTEINVDVLAGVIPDNLFEFIWFDSCYMSNIETIYEFKNKCKYFIGYPTEVMDDGMPYDIVLPLLAKEHPDIIEGAKLFFDYYLNYPISLRRIATVAVIDMSKIDDLADFCEEQNQLFIPATTSFIKYTRGNIGPFYDLGDYTKAMINQKITATSVSLQTRFESGELSEEEYYLMIEDLDENKLLAEWENVLNQVVVYKNATNRDFNGFLIPANRFSGISAHIYNFNSTDQSEDYYKSYDWFKRVFNL